jgi:hypothetical protein
MTLEQLKRLPKLDENATFFGIKVSELDRDGLLVLAECLRSETASARERVKEIVRLNSL